jgi:hypothetical protein
MNDIKQTIVNKQQQSREAKTTTCITSTTNIFPFPLDFLSTGLMAQEAIVKKKIVLEKNKNYDTLGKKQNNGKTIEDYVDGMKQKEGEENVPMLFDKTKNKVTGGKEGLTLVDGGSVQEKSKHRKGHVGSLHLLQAKVVLDDQLAEEFLTDELNTTQQTLFNKQTQIVTWDIKRCIFSMLLSTLIEHIVLIIPPSSLQYTLLLNIIKNHYIHEHQEYASQIDFDGFILNQPTLSPKFELFDPKYHQISLSSTINFQSLIVNRVVNLFYLLNALLTISTVTIQSSLQTSSTNNNVSWLGFGGPAGSFMSSQLSHLQKLSQYKIQHNT